MLPFCAVLPNKDNSSHLDTCLHCRRHHHRPAILELGGRDLEGELESFEIIKILFVGGSIN